MSTSAWPQPFQRVSSSVLCTFRVAIAVLFVVDCYHERGLRRVMHRGEDKGNCSFAHLELGEGVTYTTRELTLVLYWVCVACSIAILFDVQYHLAAIVQAGIRLWVFNKDKACWNNHSFFFCQLSFLMIYCDGGRRFDARVPRWQLDLLRFCCLVVYAAAGLCKFERDWLNGSAIWGIAGATALRARAMALGGIFVDCGVPTLMILSWLPSLRQTRPRLCALFKWMAIAVTVAFNASNYLMFPLGIFPLSMLGSSVLFLDAHEPLMCYLWVARKLSKRRWLSRLFYIPRMQILVVRTLFNACRACLNCDLRPLLAAPPRPGRTALAPAAAAGAGLQEVATSTLPREARPSWSRRLNRAGVRLFLAVWALASVAVPSTRLWAGTLPDGALGGFDGPPHGTWDMFLRNGRWSFAVVNAVDRRTGEYIQRRRNFLLDLTTRQLKNIFKRADMTAIYGHCLKQLLVKEGRAESVDHVKVQISAWIALNGRPYQRLIDPDSPWADDIGAAHIPVPTLPPTPWLMPVLHEEGASWPYAEDFRRALAEAAEELNWPLAKRNHMLNKANPAVGKTAFIMTDLGGDNHRMIGKRVSRITLLRGPGKLVIEITGKELVSGPSSLHRASGGAQHAAGGHAHKTTNPSHALDRLLQRVQVGQDQHRLRRGRRLLDRPVLQRIELTEPMQSVNFISLDNSTDFAFASADANGVNIATTLSKWQGFRMTVQGERATWVVFPFDERTDSADVSERWLYERYSDAHGAQSTTKDVAAALTGQSVNLATQQVAGASEPPLTPTERFVHEVLARALSISEPDLAGSPVLLEIVRRLPTKFEADMEVASSLAARSGKPTGTMKAQKESIAKFYGGHAIHQEGNLTRIAEAFLSSTKVQKVLKRTPHIYAKMRDMAKRRSPPRDGARKYGVWRFVSEEEPVPMDYRKLALNRLASDLDLMQWPKKADKEDKPEASGGRASNRFNSQLELYNKPIIE